MTKTRIFFFALSAFVFGIGLRSFFEIPYVLLLIGTLLGATFFIFALGKKDNYFFLVSFVLLATVLGILRYDWYDRSQPSLINLYDKKFEMKGYVYRDPVRSNKSQLFPFYIESLNGQKLDTPFQARVTTRRFPEYKIGDVLQMTGTLEEPKNLGGFDYASYLKKDAIFAVLPFPQIESISERRGSQLFIFLYSAKALFEENIERVILEPHAALAKGLLLGERDSIPDELKDAFARAGVTHIIALSGYNITIVGMFFMSLLLFFTVPYYRAFWIASTGIVLFVLLTGASPSVTRAGIMGILLLVAAREGRMYQIKNALAFAAAVMIFVNPYILRFDIAFELSFLATIGLMIFTPRIIEWLGSFSHFVKSGIRGREELDRGQTNIFVRTLAETLGAQIAVLPLLLFSFGRVSLISPLSNVLVVLAVPYAMAASFVTGLLGFLGDIFSQIPAFISWAILEYMIRIIEFFSRVPHASVEVSTHSSYSILFVGGVALIFYFLIIRYERARRAR